MDKNRRVYELISDIQQLNLDNQENYIIEKINPDSSDTNLEEYNIRHARNLDFDYSVLKNDIVHGVKQQSETSKVFDNYIEDASLDKFPNLHSEAKELMSQRFDGYYPIVIDLETGGLNERENPILQIGAVALSFDKEGNMIPYAECKLSLHPTVDSVFNIDSLNITGINPFDLSRKAVKPELGLTSLCKFVRQAQKAHGCKRSLIVAHNAAFDARFLHHNIEKFKVKRSPFHPFCNFDTTSIAGLFTKSTKLVEATQRMNINYDENLAHDALYDAHVTAELFCKCNNLLRNLSVDL